MFNPNREQVRRFFCDAWRKHLERQPLAGIEPVAVDIIALHPEYHALIGNPEPALQAEFTPEGGQMNPFLHLSLHLALAEQLAIDQPPGIRSAYQRMAQRHTDEHDALHAALECLGEVLWRSQREGGALDGAAYLECLRRA